MRDARLALIIAVSSLVAGACNKSSTVTTNQTQPGATASATAPPSAATPDGFASARANFKKHCAVCHGEEAKGGIVKVENVRLKVPGLREGHARTHTDEQFVKQITNGGEGMPKFKDKLTPEEINDLARFIRHEFQGGKPPEMKGMKGMKMD
jgi:mono/diheme cytochrome c family protein